MRKEGRTVGMDFLLCSFFFFFLSLSLSDVLVLEYNLVPKKFERSELGGLGACPHIKKKKVFTGYNIGSLLRLRLRKRVVGMLSPHAKPTYKYFLSLFKVSSYYSSYPSPSQRSHF